MGHNLVSFQKSHKRASALLRIKDWGQTYTKKSLLLFLTLHHHHKKRAHAHARALNDDFLYLI